MHRPLVAFGLALALQGCAWWQGRGRVYTTDCTYAGVRGHTDLSGAAVTVQVETDAPACREVYERRRSGTVRP